MADDLAFILRGRPFGGGVNSVVQEFAALVDGFGVGRLVVEERHLEQFRTGYAWSPEALTRVSADPASVPDGAAVVATTNDSLGLVRDLFAERTSRTYYYVQDYELLFYPRHSRQHLVAGESYTRVQEAVAVVKTRWLADTLMAHTFFPVVVIRPSIDRSLYRPLPRPAGRRRVLAMVRPVTPRRGSVRTVAVVNRLAAATSLPLDVEVFGCERSELAEAGLSLHRRVRNHGRLSARAAGELVRSADLLLDLSDYQAFGRTVAEGMAAGVVPVVTDQGAPPEFVDDGRSGFLVAPHDIDAAYAAVVRAAQLPEEELAQMRLAALGAVAGWSVQGTAADWFHLMRDA